VTYQLRVHAVRKIFGDGYATVLEEEYMKKERELFNTYVAGKHLPQMSMILK